MRLKKLGLIPRVKDDVGPYFQIKLQEIGSHPAVAEVRGFGLIAAIELIPREGRDALTPSSMLGLKAWSLIREEGAMVRGIRDLIALAPPLIITRTRRLTNFSIAYVADWTDSGTDRSFWHGFNC